MMSFHSHTCRGRWKCNVAVIGLGCLLAGCATSGVDDQATDFASEEAVSFLMEERSPPVPLSKSELDRLSEGPGRNAKAAAAHGLLALQSFGEVGTGEGLMIGMWDGGGVLETHQEFSPSRVINGDDIERVHWHATHVAGTLAAVGVDGFDEARGMAPDATLLAMNYCGDVRQEIENAYDNYANLAVTNHSYSQPFQLGQYTRMSRTFDDLIYERPEAVLVVAAGNSGCGSESDFECLSPADDGREYRTIDAPGTAKNVISVGSMSDLPYGLEVENVNLLKFDPIYGDIAVETYSGVGPTADGRIKPDVVANGDRLYSSFSEYASETDCTAPAIFPDPMSCSAVDANGDDTGKCYKDDSGTSMATPTVSGIVAVLQEIALNETPLKRLMSAVEVRALLVHTAVSVDSKPKYKYGWGAVSTKHAMEHLRAWTLEPSIDHSMHYINLTEVSDGFVLQLERKLNRRNKPVPARITLAWNDPPSSALTHNLDMVLRASDDEAEILPWTLDSQQPLASAMRGKNTVDNLERIDVFKNEYKETKFELEIFNARGSEIDAVLLLTGFEIAK